MPSKKQPLKDFRFYFMCLVQAGLSISFAFAQPTRTPARGRTYFAAPYGSDIRGRGTLSAPYKTAGYAARHVPGYRNNTLQLLPGIYWETDPIVLAPGINLKGSGRSRTILKAAGKLVEITSAKDSSGENGKLHYEGALIQLISPSYNNDVTVLLDSLSKMNRAQNGNQLLSGFTIDGSNRRLKAGVWVQNRNNVTMRDVTIRDCRMRGAVFAKGDMTADSALPDSQWMRNTHIDHCTFINTSADLKDESLGNLCLAGLDGADIHHIVINENQGYGIKFIYYGHYRNIKIHDCRIRVPEYDPLWKEDISIELWNLSYGNEVYNIQCNTWLSFVNQIAFQDYEPSAAHPINLRVHGIRLIDTDGQSQKESVECALSGVQIYDSYFQDKALGIAIWGGAGWGGKLLLHDITIRNNIFVNRRRIPTFGFGNSAGVFIPDPVHTIHICDNVFDHLGNAVQLRGRDFWVLKNIFLDTEKDDVNGGDHVLFAGNLKSFSDGRKAVFIGNISGCNNVADNPKSVLYRARVRYHELGMERLPFNIK